jgi:orotidine-5'-phosphate decarboxylase
MNIKERIIVPLDVPDEQAAIALIERLSVSLSGKLAWSYSQAQDQKFWRC